MLYAINAINVSCLCEKRKSPYLTKIRSYTHMTYHSQRVREIAKASQERKKSGLLSEQLF